VPVLGSRSKIRNSAAGVREAGEAPALQLLPLSLLRAKAAPAAARQRPLQGKEEIVDIFDGA